MSEGQAYDVAVSPKSAEVFKFGKSRHELANSHSPRNYENGLMVDESSSSALVFRAAFGRNEKNDAFCVVSGISSERSKNAGVCNDQEEGDLSHHGQTILDAAQSACTPNVVNHKTFRRDASPSWEEK